MCNFWVWLGSDAGLTLGQLANVQTVGIGLYLALAVVQAVSATGVAGLVRRVATLRTAVSSASMRLEVANVRRLSGDVSGLEIGFHDLNRRLLRIVFLLFIISVAYFAYCTIRQNADARQWGVIVILFLYLGLPIVIFVAFGIIIRRRCREVAQKVQEVQTRVQSVLLGI